MAKFFSHPASGNQPNLEVLEVIDWYPYEGIVRKEDYFKEPKHYYVKPVLSDL